MVDTVFPTPNTYTPRQGRQVNAALMGGATAARPLGAFTGVRPGTPANTVTATSSTVTVQPFGGTADVQTAGIAGPYEFAFDGVYTVALVAQSASVPRSDIVYVQINDNQEDGTGATNSSSATRVYQAGTTVTIPSPPNSRTFIIAVINVPVVGSAPTVTWVAPYCVSAGGILPVNTYAQLQTIAGGSGLNHATVFADSTATNNGDYIWSGSAWVLTGGDTGWIALSLVNSWVNFGGAYQNAMYRRLNGVVYVKGLIKSGVVASGTVATLPPGFRPLLQDQYATVSANLYTSLEVKSTGDIIVNPSASASSLSLAGIKFVAEA